MPTRSINALRLFARRAIAQPSLTTSWTIPLYRDPSSPVQASDGSGSRRWIAQDARRDGPRYRNRTKHFKQDREKPDAVPVAEIDEPTVSFAPEELVPGRPMLERIVKDIQESGTTFILPTGDEAIQEVLEPFRRLQSIGVKPEFVIRSCFARPELFKLLVSKCEDTITALSTLVEICQISYEDALRLVSSYPEVLTDGVRQIQLALDALIVNGVPAGRSLGSLVKRCPLLLFARPPEELKKGVQGLADFFSRKQISMIIQRCPDVLLKSIEETEQKYEYIFYQMGLDGEQFTDCAKWGSMALENIIERHEFLVKCGRFRTPDPKHPQLKMENPSLRSILDTNDEHFASQVAHVTLEEWIIYLSLCVKETEMATKEHPFARVKPSMRKAYERRRKETVEVPEHVFDVSANSGH